MAHGYYFLIAVNSSEECHRNESILVHERRVFHMFPFSKNVAKELKTTTSWLLATLPCLQVTCVCVCVHASHLLFARSPDPRILLCRR